MEKFLHLSTKHALAVLILASLTASAQQPAPAAPQPAPAQQQTVPDTAQPHGEVLFQSHGEPPAAPQDATDAPTAHTNSAPSQDKSQQPTGPALTDKERAAILFTAYDLDARLTPANSQLSMRASLTLRNIGSEPLMRIALQISSTLHWESASLIPGAKAAPIKLALAQHLLDTDADHTGKANEAILTLPQPLDPGASIRLDTFYAGTITASAGRLERIGANPAQALAADWDRIGVGAGEAASSNGASGSSNSSVGGVSDASASNLDTTLRGFGDVLWYPVAEPQLFLGDGAALFHAIDRTRLREQDARIHLRIAVEYKGDPPVAVYFCGRRQPLVALPDDADSPVASGAGIATADFSAEPIGFRLPSLFVVDNLESLIAPLPGSSVGASAAAGPAANAAPMLAVETSDEGALPRLAESAQSVAPLLQQWFGPRPLTALTILDHDGQPFEDGPLLVAPIDSLASSSASGALANSLAHAWVQTGQPWMDAGLAEFVSLLWIEQQKGREAANAQLNELIQPLNLVEPDFAPIFPIDYAIFHRINSPIVAGGFIVG